MREILFRGKRKDNGEWVYGNLFIPDKADTPTQICTGTNVTRISFYISPETVGQYTGLVDKNGKKIFEGDIVEANSYIFVVKFGKCGGVDNNDNYGYMGFYFDGFDKITKDCIEYGLRNDICYFTEREVIGNIHDNPELLEVDND